MKAEIPKNLRTPRQKRANNAGLSLSPLSSLCRLYLVARKENLYRLCMSEELRNCLSVHCLISRKRDSLTDEIACYVHTVYGSLVWHFIRVTSDELGQMSATRYTDQLGAAL